MIDLSNFRILIIGINYWPEQTGIGPYTTEIAEYLASSGASVKVITGVPHYPSWKVGKEYGRVISAHESRNGVEILRLRHSVPRRMTAVRRAVYEASFATHAFLRGLRERPDLVLAVTPALGGAVAGAVLARRLRCPLVIQVQDLMAMATSQSGLTGANRTTARTAQVEGNALRVASTVVMVSEGFRYTLVSYGIAENQLKLIQNWTRIVSDPTARNEARQQLGLSRHRFLVLHTGNMGFKQDLGNIIEAARQIQNPIVEFLFTGDGSQRKELQQQAACMGNVKWLGIVEESLYPTYLAAADVLLVNERASVGEMSMPSKLTSYLAAGRPIVAAVSKGGATFRYLSTTSGAALLVEPGDPKGLACSIETLVHDQDLLTSMREASSDFALHNLDRHFALEDFLQVIASLLEESDVSPTDPFESRKRIHIW